MQKKKWKLPCHVLVQLKQLPKTIRDMIAAPAGAGGRKRQLRKVGEPQKDLPNDPFTADGLGSQIKSAIAEKKDSEQGYILE